MLNVSCLPFLPLTVASIATYLSWLLLARFCSNAIDFSRGGCAKKTKPSRRRAETSKPMDAAAIVKSNGESQPISEAPPSEGIAGEGTGQDKEGEGGEQEDDDLSGDDDDLEEGEG